eukprot:TRINITY_DN34771_c0_g1_i1.p1 TRINITY_DN34771_c0_g1~~TRINITY_DN34771_c0_g1_i1.p1  ORF type:complete len:204 (-),score=36.10 TRINITY_DN34771_c0_g1_i1:113-667(-)
MGAGPGKPGCCCCVGDTTVGQEMNVADVTMKGPVGLLSPEQLADKLCEASAQGGSRIHLELVSEVVDSMDSDGHFIAAEAFDEALKRATSRTSLASSPTIASVSTKERCAKRQSTRFVHRDDFVKKLDEVHVVDGPVSKVSKSDVADIMPVEVHKRTQARKGTGVTASALRKALDASDAIATSA